MSIIELLDDPGQWQAFLIDKLDKGHLSKRDEQSLTALIECRSYLQSAHTIQHGDPLPPPQKILLNKLGTAKKRTVYSFEPELMWTLKLLAWLLYRYDHVQPQGCYSFRRGYGAQLAFRQIIQTPDIDGLWCCKLDISDYFNSIDISRLLPIIDTALAEDPLLCAFFARYLTARTAVQDGVLLREDHGVMAGTPTAPFLANLYLAALDSHFVELGQPYARYSDDIIIFAASQAQIERCRTDALEIIGEHGLNINWDKTSLAAPGDPWEFLGMSYHHGTIDISKVTQAKLKGKIRRKARALRRWMLRKEASAERAQRAFVRSFNEKFFESRGSNDLTWSRWFFPMINTASSLREIDHYMQQYIRYIPTGRFNSANYRLGYRQIKELGYRSLVNEYYRRRDGRPELV